MHYGVVVEIDRNKKTKRVTIQSPVEVCIKYYCDENDFQ